MEAPLLLGLFGNDNEDEEQHEHWNILNEQAPQTVTVGEASTVRKTDVSLLAVTIKLKLNACRLLSTIAAL